MSNLKCPKCGKLYKRGGFYYEQHVERCDGEKQHIKAFHIKKNHMVLKKE